MSYGYFSKYDREVVRVFQIREHHAQIVKLGRYATLFQIFSFMLIFLSYNHIKILLELSDHKDRTLGVSRQHLLDMEHYKHWHANVEVLGSIPTGVKSLHL